MRRLYCVIYNLILTVLYTVRQIFNYFCEPEEVSVDSDIVLVTGGANGIGKEVAYQYGKLGARVILADINEEALATTKEEFLNEGIQVFTYYCDFSLWEQVDNLKKNIEKDVGVVTILVNSVGLGSSSEILEKTSKVTLKKMIEVNILSVCWALKSFLPAMKKNNFGSIVTLGSIMSILPLRNCVVYSATKAAIYALMRGAREEAAHDGSKVHFLTVLPDFTRTNMTSNVELDCLCPKKVAECIVKAQRKGYIEISVPCYSGFVSRFLSFMPEYTANDIHIIIQELRNVKNKGTYVMRGKIDGIRKKRRNSQKEGRKADKI